MQLHEKILNIYPELNVPYNPFKNPPYILQDDGQGAYIKQWNHIQPKPTQEQLDALNNA